MRDRLLGISLRWAGIALLGAFFLGCGNEGRGIDAATASVAGARTPASITTRSLPIAQRGTAYGAMLAASGGTWPYTWKITKGPLPTGLSLNASTGEISGTPSAAGTSNFTAEVTDSSAPTAQTYIEALSIVVGPQPSSTTGILPADRAFPWNPGLRSMGGIPNRATVCAKVSPSGRDDSDAIQAALDRCRAGEIVQLSAGTFIINSRYLLIHSSITLRGAGPGLTILSKTNGATPRTNTVVAGTIATGGSLNSHIYVPSSQHPADAEPIIIVGNARWPRPDSTTSQNLTADGAAGSYSVTIANANGFTAGQIVLLDEISKWAYSPVPSGFSPSGVEVAAGDHVVFQMHNPRLSVDDPPAAFGWFNRGYQPNSSSQPDTDGRMTNEIKEIAAVNGNRITFTTPLAIDYRASHLAQLTRYTAHSNGGNGAAPVTLAGVESLTMRGGSDGSLRFEVATYSWAKNVEVTQWIGEGIAIDNSYKVEVRGSYIHTGSEPTPGGGGYAISLAAGSSEVLIEDNIVRDANKVMVARACGTGSVVGYNYMDDGWISYQPGWQEIGLNASHMAGPHHVLFEGNYSFNMDSDYTHGSSQFMTYFRNYVTGQRGSWVGPDANSRTAGVSAWAKEFTFIGNVMGRPGQMSGWLYTDPMMGCDANGSSCVGGVAGTWGHGTGNIWQIGYDATNQWRQEAELGALSTVIRDGNYDYLTNSVHWHNTPNGYSIPASLYLSAKPAFFGNYTWPWVNPTGKRQLYTLPAKARYDAGTPFALAPGATQ
jgi:Putative Ig domain